MRRPTDRPVYYKRDFSLILRLYACSTGGDGERREIGFPDYDWVARFYTWWDAESYTASCIGGKCVNCFNDNGQIHVVFDNHRLSPGELKVEFTALLPDGMYPDGNDRVVVPGPLGITLTREAAPCPSAMDVELMLPYILAEVPVLGYVELVSDKAVYRLPVTVEPAVREELPPAPWYGYGYYDDFDNSIGTWDI